MNEYFRIEADSGKRMDIYYIKGNGISLRSGPEGNRVLLPNGFYDFDCAYQCKSDTVHILGQNGEGSIVHILHGKEGWKRKELLTGKLKLPYPKYFRLLEEGERLLGIFSIRHEGECLLVSQIPGEEELPSVIDYLSERAPRFWAGGLGGTASVVYRARNGELREKKRMDGKWMNGFSFPIGENEELLDAFAENGEEHRWTQEKSGGSSTLRHYIRKDGRVMSQTLEENVTDFQDICVFYEEKTLCCVSLRRDSGHFYRYRGKTWEEDYGIGEWLSGQRALRKGIRLGDRRSECVGRMEAQGFSVLFPREGSVSPSPDAALTERLERMQTKITEMERRISRMENAMRKENRN